MAIGIFKLFKDNKEAKALELLRDHIDKVHETKEIFLEAYDISFMKNHKKSKEASVKVSQKEHEADEITKEFTEKIYEGAFLGNYRAGIFKLIHRMDKVADKLENAGKLGKYVHKAHVKKALQVTLDKMKDQLSASVDNLRDVVHAFLDEDECKFKTASKAVKQFEEDADVTQEEMYDFLLLRNFDPITLHIIGEYGHQMAAVTDAADNACDILEELQMMMNG